MAAGAAHPAAAAVPGDVSRAASPDAPRGGHSPADASIGTILRGLTLEEKVGQLFIIYHSPPEFMAEHGFGGSVVFASMVERPDELRASLARARQLCRTPLLVAMDQEGGEINRLGSLPGLAETPSARALAAWPPARIREAVAPQAAALADLGIDLNLAPVVDPAHGSDGRPTLMGGRARAFGDGPEQIIPPARAFMAGYAARNIGCVVKHFPGYDIAGNSDRELAVSGTGAAEIEIRISAFAGTVDMALGVMMSSIRFTEISPVPAVLDSVWVRRARCGRTDLLVMTDDLWGGALRAWISGPGGIPDGEYPAADLRRLVLAAFDAGNDMLMVTYPAMAVRMKAVLVEEIRGDPRRQESLDRSVLRILRAKADLGLLDP